MASIPLVALNVKNPEQPDLLQKYGQLAQLKQMQQQQQEAPLRIEALRTQNQAAQINLDQARQGQKDAQATTAAWAEFDGKDPHALPKLIIKNGGSGMAAQSAQKMIQEQQQQAATTFKAQADAGKAIVETAKQKNDMIVGALTSLHQVPDAQLPQAAASTINDLAQKGLMDPQSAQKALQVVQSGDTNAIRQGVDQFSKTLLTHTQILDQAHKEALEAQAAATAKETARYHDAEIAQGKQRINAEYSRLQFDKAKQGTQDASAIETQAQQIANGDVKGLSQARNNPFARAVMARVYEINPKYSDSLYTSTQDLRSSKPNSMGGNVGRLSTAILHGDRALQNSGGLGFSEGLLTGVATQGTSAYRQDAEFLTGEIGQYVTGGKLTVDEGKKLSADLMSSRQGVRDSAIHEIIGLSKGKLKTQMQQFKNASQTDFPTDRVFNDPDIRDALQKHGVIDGDATGKSGGFDWNAHPVAK